MEQFIKYFADQFDDTDFEVFESETIFRELDEWSSLTGLAVLNMIDKKYGVKLPFNEFRGVNTIQELYNLVQSKK